VPVTEDHPGGGVVVGAVGPGAGAGA
jgi:hypothetical protein